ncbi:hypothetical protein E1218_24665 [Kribbella turkmenica]|uniref:Uncharacterized protein n=1 Tax=Kribbella turkmenica TaxID=2530375 RepID=A0A4R4WJF5_9ACTN|nr:hypothetical protein [Kribbella turkmenica]TDD19152.1 hypothetical protein E1218_24665 [Kribbella turkmenica]
MIRQLAAVTATATLLVTTLPAAQAAAAGPTVRATCTKHALPLPADSMPGSSRAASADPSGRFILGEANREGRMHGNAVLWVHGVPRWLASQPEGESFAYSVVAGGFVLGSTYSLTKTDHWIYSAETDSYRILELPGNLQLSQLTAMNANRDILGTVLDETTGEQVPFVWPSGGQPRLLTVPSGLSVYAMDDISDEGLVIGRLNRPEDGQTSYLWRSADAEPARLGGAGDQPVWARDIEGRWIAGGDTDIDDRTGLLWNTRNDRIVKLEDSVTDLNSTRDAVTAGSFGPLGDYPSMIIKRNGAKITFPEGTILEHIFERTSKWTAAGYDVSSGQLEPIVYACR